MKKKWNHKPHHMPFPFEEVNESSRTMLLSSLPNKSRVGVVTMLGSFCPITKAHLQAFVEARKILLLGNENTIEINKNKKYDLVLGFISFNHDKHVVRKVKRKKQIPLNYNDRAELARLAILSDDNDNDKGWMGLEEREGRTYMSLKRQYPFLQFTHYTMNGADDVLKYQKWKYARSDNRFITMGRPGGDTEKLQEAISEEKAKNNNFNHSYFILGPELSNISSTDVREALKVGDLDTLERMLPPNIIQLCREKIQESSA